MHAKRKVVPTLVTLAVTAALVATGGAAPAQAAGPDLLPVTITNTTGRADAVYLYVLGVNLNTGRLGYVNAAGAFTPWTGGSHPPSPAPDVSIAGPANGASVTIQVPRGLSGRVYFSLGKKIDFLLTPDGLVQPAPWAPADANRDTLFDWSEFTYNDAGLWLNSSQVDMFAIPHRVAVTGSAGAFASTGVPVANGRENVINAIKALPEWANSIYTRSDGTVLRVLAPGKATDVGLMSPTLLDSYIASAWSAYATNTLTVAPFSYQPEIKYYGRTAGDTMVFTDGTGFQVASIQRPSSANVWNCDGNLLAPNDLVVGPIARTLCAALNRGTLGKVAVEPSTNASDFYQGAPANLYSKIIHENMADGKAYGFPFDDVGGHESLVHDGNPRAAGIMLTSF